MALVEEMSNTELFLQAQALVALAPRMMFRILEERTVELVPELARRLQERDRELKDVRQALDIGPGEPIDSEITDAIEELQKQAARVRELETLLDAVRKERDLLRCDVARGWVS